MKGELAREVQTYLLEIESANLGDIVLHEKYIKENNRGLLLT